MRDTGGLLSEILLVQDIAKERGPQAPEIYFAGPLIDGMPRVYDGTPARFPNISDGASTPEDAERIVDELAAAGASLIKSYEMLKPDVFRALVARATERELPVTSHIPLSMDAEAVIAAGVKGMEHLRNIGLACSNKAQMLLTERQAMLRDGAKEEGSTLRSLIHAAQRPIAFGSQGPDRCSTVIGALATAQVFQTPTLALNTRGALRQFLEPRQRDPFQHLPATVRDKWNAFADAAADTPIDPAYVAFADWSLGMVGQLHEAGVPIMAGTDTPIGLLTPGFSLHLEMEMLVKAGLSPKEALASATLRPAEFFGLEVKMGTIEAGKSSELVLLTANPLEDIANTRTIDTVITRGTVLDRTDLDALLESAAP
ncbi:MAG TPA: hydrolase [Rhodobiaceae bacterium]|nr:hydrolase [Rhodobiaceae bacterium]